MTGLPITKTATAKTGGEHTRIVSSGRDWTTHDAAVPFHDPRLAKLNGTNKAGRRPHSLVDPERLRPANDNRREADADAA